MTFWTIYRRNIEVQLLRISAHETNNSQIFGTSSVSPTRQSTANVISTD